MAQAFVSVMTIKDIAKAAGVSPSTVSKVINQKDASISEETRQRVLRAIEESDYIPYAGVRERLLSQNNQISDIRQYKLCFRRYSQSRLFHR